ncbi:hypothetical protein JR316_0005117 [Psilocybe cubensis]|uniref:Uncharacterized protein n=1 Tax=Psilocybe cubensis TaxID=181762 RepID=A0ACB8H5T6_PSICU|nr:hypothetical protein JR316_0005117 [Psilocybe cubensis]KAH9483017.1 hypothetical protein JR316_0005117 [Psilocybe cubensis]
METVVENQDSRALPEGWVQNYEPSYYVQMNVMPPKVSFTHPADLAPAGKQKSASPSSSLVSESRSGTSAAPSPHSSPVPLANVSPQPKGRTSAQELYASYLNKTMPPMINASGLTSLAVASGTSQAQVQAQMDERRFMRTSPPPVSSVNWVGQTSASPPLRAPIPRPVPGSRQLPTPPHSSDESPVTSPAPYLQTNSNTSPNVQTTFGNVSIRNGANDNTSKPTSPLPNDANYQLHRAQSLQTGSSVPDHFQHAHQRSQTFAPGQTRQVGHNPNNVVSNEIPVNGLRQTPALVTHARLPSQSPSFTTVATNPVASTAQSQPNRSRHYTTIATNPVAFEAQPQGNQSTNFTNMATNHVNQMGASPGAVSVGNTGVQSLPTIPFSQTARAMGPLPSPPMSPPNNTSPTFTGTTFANPTFSPQINSTVARPKNQLTNSMGKIATKLAVGAASGLISQATGIPTTVVRSVSNIITDPRVTAMFKRAFSRQNGPIGDNDLQAVLQGHPNANYQGVIDALIKQQQEFNTIQMQASMAYKPIPQSPVDYPALIAEVQRLQQQARVQAQAAQTQAQIAAAQAAASQSTLNSQYQSIANQLTQQIAQQGIQAVATNQSAYLPLLQAYLAAQGQQLPGGGLQQGQQQNVPQAQSQSATQQQVQVHGAPQQQQAGQQQTQAANGTIQPQQHQSPNTFVANVPQKPVQHLSVTGGTSFAPGRPTAIGGGQTAVSSGGQSHPPGVQIHAPVNQLAGGQPQTSGVPPHVSAGQIHSGAHTSQSAGQHPSNNGHQQQNSPAGGQPQTSPTQQNNGGQGENPYTKLYDQIQDVYQQVQQQQQQQQQPSYTDMSNSLYNGGVQQSPQQQPSFTDMINSAFNGNAQQSQQQPSFTDMINSTLNGGQQQPPLPDMLNSVLNGNGQLQQPSLTDMINSAFNNGGQQPSFTDYLNSALNGGSASTLPVYDTSLLYNDPSSGGSSSGIMDNLVQSFANTSLGGNGSLQTDTSGLNGFVNGLTQGFSTDQTDPSAFSAGFDLGSLGDSIASSITNSWSDSS